MDCETIIAKPDIAKPERILTPQADAEESLADSLDALLLRLDIPSIESHCKAAKARLRELKKQDKAKRLAAQQKAREQISQAASVAGLRVRISRRAGGRLAGCRSTSIRKAAREEDSSPKYVHPENPKLCWVGWGRRPAWVGNFIAQGRSLEECLAQKA
jgi:DNA-binding protein H-NS